MEVCHAQAIQLVTELAVISELNRLREALSELMGKQTLQEYLEAQFEQRDGSSNERRLANKQDVPYQSLMKVYLNERIRRERVRRAS